MLLLSKLQIGTRSDRSNGKFRSH